jgi:DNA-binding beta-propeller fold protein YncE
MTTPPPVDLLSFEPVPRWGRLPFGSTFGSEATSVAVHPDGRIFVFNRGPVPVLVFDRDGELIDGWGEGEFNLAHAISIDPEGNLWLTDLKHVIEKRTPEGDRLLTLGTRGRSAAPHSCEPFNRPTDAVVHPRTGDVYVTDGYLNSAVHRFSNEGEHISSWGGPGSAPGHFSLPHGVCFAGEDRVVICDRENFRLQVFTLEGEWIDSWHAYYPQVIRSFVRKDGSTWILVGEGPPVRYQRGTPNLGCRVIVMDENGKRLGQLGAGRWGFEDDHFTAIHGIGLDLDTDDIYVAEAPYATITAYYGEDAPKGELLSLRKWRLTS